MPPSLLRTYSFSTSSSSIRCGASACRITCCSRPLLGKSLTYCEPMAADSVLLMCSKPTPIASALARSISSRTLVPAGRPSACTSDSNGLASASFSSCCRAARSSAWPCPVRACRASEKPEERPRLSMAGGITLITSPSATVAIACCAASTSRRGCACALTPVLQHGVGQRRTRAGTGKAVAEDRLVGADARTRGHVPFVGFDNGQRTLGRRLTAAGSRS